MVKHRLDSQLTAVEMSAALRIGTFFRLPLRYCYWFI